MTHQLNPEQAQAVGGAIFISILGFAFSIWTVVLVYRVSSSRCRCNIGVSTGFKVMLIIQIVVCVLTFLFVEKVPFLIPIMLYIMFINSILYFVFFVQANDKQCICYRQNKGQMITLLLFAIIGFMLGLFSLYLDVKKIIQ